ncbi:MAG: flagellar biosynthetic protein FliP, partial [Planctomycetaceae bacterium]
MIRVSLQRGRRRFATAMLGAVVCAAAAAGAARADGDAAAAPAAGVAADPGIAAEGLRGLFDRVPVESLLPSALAFGVISLVPAVLLMTTCFVRISVVLALVRQGLGAPQIPSNQIVAALAIFLSALVM